MTLGVATTISGGLAVVSTVEAGAGILTQLLGIAVLATLPAAACAVGYRSIADERLPRWLAVGVGVAAVALYLGTTPALETVVDPATEPSESAVALFNVAALLLGAGGALAGRAVGDRFGVDVLRWSPTQTTSEDVGRLAQTVGQVTTVSLPTTIEDTPGYDPIPERTKRSLEGKQFVFPRGLRVAELEQRVTEQLRSDYGVGTAEMNFDEQGDIAFLAVGTRAAGIGSTLPPATNAIALRADPGFSASPGDIVQVWEPSSMQRVLTGELRGVADDVVTIAIDAADTPKVDPTRRYRLVTLPVNDRPDREFASLLRAAEETFSSVTVEAGSPLHGLPVGALDCTITAIRPEAGDPVPFPDSRYRLAPGDRCFVIARPGDLRRLETAAEPLDPTVVSESAPTLPSDESEPDGAIQTSEPTARARDQPTGEDGLPADGDSQPAAETDSLDQSAGDTGGETAVSGKADADSFEQIKSEMESGDESSSESADATAEASTPNSSFQDLKSEFESGDADWGESSEESAQESTGMDDEGSDGEITFDDSGADAKTDEQAEDGDGNDELVSLEEAEISFDDDDDEATPESDSGGLGEIEIDDDLQGDAGDAISDDIGDLEFEDKSEDVSELDLSEDQSVFDAADEQETPDEADDGESADDESDEDSEGDEAEEEDDDDDDESGGGGATSFAQLKEEFESGDADWEDDVSDSPGGDMRLDE